MVRLSPSNAIYWGVLTFTDVKTHNSIRVGATLDTYHSDLRFEFEGKPLFYNYGNQTFAYDNQPAIKRLPMFFWQALEEDGPIYFISFTFQITRDVISTYQVSGTVMGENVNADSNEDL